MCGFVGAFSSEKLSLECKENLKLMIKKISHRGPDGSGYYEHNNFNTQFARLSIIDLNNRSNQPFIDSSKWFVLVFNGEIYNFLKLKKELKKDKIKFKTSSDTEVVIESFKKWGKACLNKFEGMFSFVIFDKKNKSIFLCRDQLGIKPLYYLKLNKVFYFSSEIKTFKNILKFGLNKEKIIEFSVFGSIAGEETLIKGIKQINPGNLLELNSKINIKKKNYFNLKDTFYNSKEKNSLDDIHQELINSVKTHTISDVGYATQLSGGLDSSLVTAITSKYKSKNFKLHTYSVSLSKKISTKENFKKSYPNNIILPIII